jgi:hypothetical protein
MDVTRRVFPRVLGRVRVVPAGLVALLLCLAGVIWSEPAAHSVVDTDIPYDVRVSPTEGLSDGAVVTIEAEVDPSRELYAITAHLCLPGAGISNTYDFGFQGPYCPNVGVGSGEHEVVGTFRNTSRGSIAFRVGEGSLLWVDEIGYPHTIACDPQHACDLVVQLQATNATVHHTVPLRFGPVAPAPPSTAPPVAPASPGATGGGPGAAPGAGSGSGSGAASGATGATPSSPGGESASAPSAPPGANAARDTPPGSFPVEIPASRRAQGPVVSASGLSADDTRRALRVFSAGAAGLIGGALIVFIVGRAQRKVAAAR